MAQASQVQHGLHELLLLLQARSPSPQAALVVSVLLVCPLLVLLVARRFGTPSTATATARAREEQLSKLPSPPSRLAIIGHLHLVGPLPHISLRDLAAEHGRDGLMLLRLGAVPTLVVSSPSAAQAVLRTQDHVFVSRAYSPVTEILFYGPSDVAFCPYGAHWRQFKKIATTHLLTNKKVRSYRHAREHEVVARAVAASPTPAAAADASHAARAGAGNSATRCVRRATSLRYLPVDEVHGPSRRAARSEERGCRHARNARTGHPAAPSALKNAWTVSEVRPCAGIEAVRDGGDAEGSLRWLDSGEQVAPSDMAEAVVGYEAAEM